MLTDELSLRIRTGMESQLCSTDPRPGRPNKLSVFFQRFARNVKPLENESTDVGLGVEKTV